jgi:hypothetical protein
MLKRKTAGDIYLTTVEFASNFFMAIERRVDS